MIHEEQLQFSVLVDTFPRRQLLASAGASTNVVHYQERTET